MEIPQLSPLEAPEPFTPANAMSRFINVIAAPREAFAGMATVEKRASLWLFPMIAMIIVSSAVAWVLMSNPEMQLKMRTQMREQFDNLPADKKLTPQQADDMIDMQVKLSPIMGAVGALLAVPAMWLLVSGVFYGIVSFILGGHTSYSRVLAVYGIASIIMVIETMVTTMMQVGIGSLTASISLGFLMDAKTNAYIHGALTHINPFTFWWMWVFALGLAEISGLTWKKALGGIAGAWVLYCAVTVTLGGLPFFAKWQG
jgi:hypothetical protein